MDEEKEFGTGLLDDEIDVDETPEEVEGDEEGI